MSNSIKFAMLLLSVLILPPLSFNGLHTCAHHAPQLLQGLSYSSSAQLCDQITCGSVLFSEGGIASLEDLHPNKQEAGGFAEQFFLVAASLPL